MTLVTRAQSILVFSAVRRSHRSHQARIGRPGLVARVAAESLVERPLLAESSTAGGEGRAIVAADERTADDPADLAEILVVEASHRHRRRPEPDPGGHGRRPLVERHGVPVDGDRGLGEPLLGVLAGPLRRTQVDLQQVRVGAAGKHVETAILQRLGEHVGIPTHLCLIGPERLRRGDREAGRLGCDHVLERPSLHAWEDRAVERLGVLLLAEHEARARSRKRLVRRRRHEIAVRHRIRVQAGRDEPGEVGHVAHQEGANLVGDLAEAVGLDRTRVGRPATDDQLRSRRLRDPQHVVVVDKVRLRRYAVARNRVEAPREIDFEPVRQVSAMRELEPEQRVARLQTGEVDTHVRLRPRVRLHVRVLGTVERLDAVDR